MCNKCKGTGLIPFIKLDGTVSKHAKIFCPTCYQAQQDKEEHYPSPSVEDYDFACSDFFRAWTYQHCGVPDPFPDRPVEVKPKPQEQVIVHRQSNMSKQDYDILQQTSRRVQHVEKKLAELEAKKNKADYY